MTAPILISLDIETKCGLGCDTKCEHALDEHRNAISVVGLYYEQASAPVAKVFRSLPDLSRHLHSLGDYALVGQNLKFDLKTLAAKGLNLASRWEDDTQLMAACLTEKISPEYLAWYAQERERRNKELPKGCSHRPGSLHSLKTLAPYFLGVEPFWENPANHDNDEYVLQDCYYTYQLASVLANKLKEEDGYAFYKTKLLPWTKMLLEMERMGVRLDVTALEQSQLDASRLAADAARKIHTLWAPAFLAHRELQEQELAASYYEKKVKALEKAKDKARCEARYEALHLRAASKIEPFNLDSPAQLSWLLRDYLKLDITDFHGDEGTGKAILQKLATQGREDIATFLEYRKQTKLATAFFPSYKELMYEGNLHCSFNPTGTRTGRLSSSGPNLQQVPGHLHSLFIARPGRKLATKDMSAIEPRLIAYFTQDLNLVDIVRSGADFHGNNARIFFGLDCETKEVKERYPHERKMAKEVGLSLFYGAGSGRLEETAQKYGFTWSRRHCQEVLKRFKEEYEGVYHFRDNVLNPVLMSGARVTNLFGRNFSIPDPTDVHMQGLNTLIQGSASDMVLNSAHKMMEEFKRQNIAASVLLLVHDEIVTEIPEDSASLCEQIIDAAMTQYDLPTPYGNVPLAVEGKIAGFWSK